MFLTEYLKRNELSKKEFADIAGLCIPTIFQLYKGKTIQLPTAIKIQRATHGKVSCEEIYTEFLEKKDIT